MHNICTAIAIISTKTAATKKMSWEGALTKNAIALMLMDNPPLPASEFKPFLQVIDVKRVQPNKARPGFPGAAQEKIRLVLSDGSWYGVGIVGSAVQNAVKEKLTALCCVQLTEYHVTNMQGKK
jgi:hypothetical protein